MSPRDRILALRGHLKREPLVEPAWQIAEADGLYVSALNSREREDFEISFQESKKGSNTANIRGRLLALTIRDADGRRVFNDDDAAALGELDAAAMDLWFRVAQRLSGLRKEDVEAVEKKSTGQGGASPSA